MLRVAIPALLLMAPGLATAQQSVRQQTVPVVSGPPASGVVLSVGPVSLASVNAVNGSTAGYAVLYDAATVPADGAISPTLIRWCMPIAANTGIYTPLNPPQQFYYGVTFFVSSTSCTAKTAVAYGYIAAQVRQ